MTIRLAIEPIYGTGPVEMDVHHILSDGQLVATPTRTETLLPGRDHSVTLHSRIALVFARDPDAPDEPMALEIVHCDPEMPWGLDLVELAVPESGEPVELPRRLPQVAPGGVAVVEMAPEADVLIIREIEWPRGSL